MLLKVVDEIQKAQSILLTTHRQCDGDGLGSELALFFALKKTGKEVRILNVDDTPKKYDFLAPSEHIQCFDGHYDPIATTDLALIFDTNDRRLVEPLYHEIEKQCGSIIFIDHHPILKQGPTPTENSYIDRSAASTGELTFQLINALEIPIDESIAKALYTSLVFDTQLFRYVRSSPTSHEIAAQLLKFPIKPEAIHRHLFGNFTSKKMIFIAEVMQDLELYFDDRFAILVIQSTHLKKLDLDIDDTRDLIDMLMNIESLEGAAVFREDAPNQYKLSLRSKGQFSVTAIAEKLGGGGHAFASGARLHGAIDDFRATITQAVQEGLKIS